MNAMHADNQITTTKYPAMCVDDMQFHPEDIILKRCGVSSRRYAGSFLRVVKGNRTKWSKEATMRSHLVFCYHHVNLKLDGMDLFIEQVWIMIRDMLVNALELPQERGRCLHLGCDITHLNDSIK